MARRIRRNRVVSSKVILYVRVSTEEQASSQAGLNAQRAALTREAEARGWADVEWIEDAGYSAGSMDRPGMQRALGMLTSGEASILAAAKLDRVSRSVIDCAELMSLANETGFGLVLLDIGVDTSTAAGRMVANVMAAVAEWERDTIRERTRVALAAKKAAGVVLGRPRVLSERVYGRIAAMRAGGLTYAAIADTLNAESVPTARGNGRWYPSTVYQIAKAA